jgi:hypothetical protein
MPEEETQLKERVVALEREVAALRQRGAIGRGVRRRSESRLWGLPLYDIALGPDLDRGERRGHARGVLAIGDVATGLLAIGGIARGLIAFGGLAVGVVLGIGGMSLGLISLGGLALGGLAIGGLGIGAVAVGGAAAGYYALGGGALGAHVLDATLQDPEAVRFFSAWIPELQRWLPPR